MIRVRLLKTKLIFAFLFFILLCGMYINSTTFFRLKLADHYTRIQNYDKLIATYKKIVRKATLDFRRRTSESERQALNIERISNFYLTLANLLLTKNRLAESAEVLKELTKILQKETFNTKGRTLNMNMTTEKLTDLHLSLANLLLKKYRFAESAQTVKQMVEINPRYKDSSFPALSGSESYRKFGLALLRVDLKDMAIEQSQNAVEVEPDNPSGYYQLALIYQRQGMEENAITQFEKAAELADKCISNLPAYLGGIYYDLGLRLERGGNIEKAKDYYEKAIRLDGDRIIGAYYCLKSLYMKQGKFEDIESIEIKLLNLKPEYEVNHKFSDGLMLLGYSLDEREFELFNGCKITFFWELSSQNSELTYEKKEMSDIYKVGNRLYEVKEVENLAPNFGFEVDSIGEGFPCGWKTDYYGAFLENHEIVTELLPLGKSQCLMLNNNTRAERTNCQTDYIPISKDNFYLQAGWIKSINGNAYLGRRWFDSEKNDKGYDYVVLDVKLPRWRYYSQVIIPPSDSAYCRLWVINFMTHGKAYFDDVVFFRLDLPSFS